MLHKHLQFGQGFRMVLNEQAGQMTLRAGGTEGGPDNRHRGADQWLYVVSGRGAAIVNGEGVKLHQSTRLLIQHGEEHEMKNTGQTPLRTLNL